MIDRLLRAGAILLLVFALSINATAMSQRISMQATATFSSRFPEKHWSVPVKSTEGQTLYVLSLEPDFDTHLHIVTVELVLRSPNTKTEGPNLLNPRKLFGLQPYDFAAVDFSHGIDKSAFGKNRELVLRDLSLVVEMTVLEAKVSPTNSGSYQIDKLKVKVGVHSTEGSERNP